MRWLIAALLVLLSTMNAYAGRGGGGRSYGGGRHTSSHGGRYTGGRGSSHKDGTYKNSRTGNRYGKHK